MSHREDLRAVFGTAFGCEPPPGHFSPQDLEEWDSLGHVKLVLQIENDLGIRIDPTEILALHRDFDTVARYVLAHRPEASTCA
jgi:acyl carrier protein